MSHLNATRKTTKSILIASLFVISTTLALSACDKSTESDNIDSKVKTEDTIKASQISDKTIENSNGNNNNTALSLATLETALQAVKAPIRVSDKYDEEQIKCVEDIPPDFALDKVQTFYQSKFSPEEMQELNDFYTSKLAKAFTQYGRDEFLIAIGQTVDNPAPKPTEDQMQEMIAFTQTPIGTKYGKMNLEDGEGSLNELVTGLLTEELNKCDVSF